METDFAPIGEARLRQILDAVVAEGDAAEYLGLEARTRAARPASTSAESAIPHGADAPRSAAPHRQWLTTSPGS